MSDTPVELDRAAPTLPRTSTANSAPVRAETTRTIAAWLESQRERYCARAQMRGIPTSVRIRETHGAQTGPGQQSFSIVEVTRSSMWAESVQFSLAETSEAESSAAVLASQLHAAYEDGCKLHSPWTFRDPITFISQALVRPLRSEYLHGLETLERADWALAHTLAGDLVELLEGTHLRDVFWLPLAGLHPAHDPLCVGPIILRSLTSGELGALYEDAFQRTSPSRHLRPTAAIWASESHAIELRLQRPKDAQREPGYQTSALLLALQLLGFEPHGRGSALTWTEPRPTFGRIGSLFRLPMRGRTQDLGAADLEQALALAERIPQEVFEQPTKREHVALHRFHLGAAEDSAVDALVDYAVALETLFREHAGELAFRLQLLGALFVGQTPAQRFEVQRDLAQIYKLRSALVHGQPPSPAEAQKAAHKARRIAAAALVKSLREGWPDEEALLALAFADKLTP